MLKRKQVFEKSNKKCEICGCKLHTNTSKYNDNEYVQIDHIFPRSLGGSDDLDNLRALCKSCNSKRNNRSGERLIGLIVKALDKSTIDIQDRLLFLKDDIKNGRISKQQLKTIKNKVDLVYKHNIKIINNLLKPADETNSEVVK